MLKIIIAHREIGEISMQWFVLSFGDVLWLLKKMPELERTACFLAFAAFVAERLA